MSRARWVVLVAAALMLTACQPNRFVSGWVPYWQASDGRTALGNADVASLYSEVSLMWFGTSADSTTADGGIHLMASSSSLASTVATIRASGVPVIPTIFDNANPGQMKAIIADTTAMRAHVEHIVQLVNDNGYDGIDIDYEVFAFGDKMPKLNSVYTPKWVAFVQRLGSRLHANGKLLSVTVPPVWNSGFSGYTFYAQDQIAPSVDRLRLMVYDWSVGAAGPISPNFWQTSTINYTANVAKVPPKKVQLGLPAYGRHWNMKAKGTETCPNGALTKTDSITMRETAALAAAHQVTPTRDSSGELTFSWTEVKSGSTDVVPDYVPITSTIDRLEATIARTGLVPAVRLGVPRVVSCTVRHVVFVPDPTSVLDGANRAIAAGWSGVVMWAIGYETADVYRALATAASQRPGGAPVTQLGSMKYTPGATAATGTLRVVGLAWHPEFDLPVPVRVDVQQGATVVASRTVLANANRAAAMTGTLAALGPFHGVDTTFGAIAKGSYTVCVTQLAWGGTPLAGASCKAITAT